MRQFLEQALRNRSSERAGWGLYVGTEFIWGHLVEVRPDAVILEQKTEVELPSDVPNAFGAKGGRAAGTLLICIPIDRITYARVAGPELERTLRSFERGKTGEQAPAAKPEADDEDEFLTDDA